MLACLPGPGDLSLQLLSHTQMNTGLQKWDTTQRMRSAQYPTPAELDAYAKKVANSPLSIKIFPNSIKVPQRNHVRRTVNGLDTSGGGPHPTTRYSPYPPSAASSSSSQAGVTKAGLLAIVKLPLAKGVVKDFDGSRARLHPPHPHPHQDTIMTTGPVVAPHRGPYANAAAAAAAASASASTLNLHHHPHHPHHPHQAPGLQRAPSQHAQPQQHHPPRPHPHPQSTGPGLAHAQTLQPPQQAHHPAAVGLRHPQAPAALTASSMAQHTQGLPQPHPQPQTQTLPHLPRGVLGHHPCQVPPAALLQQQQQHQHQNPHNPPHLQHLHQPPPGIVGRKMPEGDAPPNVTVSTSTIPLSMVGALHHTGQRGGGGGGGPVVRHQQPHHQQQQSQPPPPDLSSIVHQISQFCQTRAAQQQAPGQGQGSATTTSMCEGQIANPSPISRNLLISASSRVSMLNSNNNNHPHHQHHPHHHPAHQHPHGPPACGITPMDNKAAAAAAAAVAATAAAHPRAPPGTQAPLGASMASQNINHRIAAGYHHRGDNMKAHPQHLQQAPPSNQHLQHHQLQQQHHQQLRPWNPTPQLAHLQHIPEGGGIGGGGHRPSKRPARDHPPGFPCKGVAAYPSEMCGLEGGGSVGGHPYPFKALMDKPTPSPPVLHNNSNGLPPGPHYTNGHYFTQQPQQQVWSSILPTPNSDSSGSQDLATMPFHSAVSGPCNNHTNNNSSATTAIDCGGGGGGGGGGHHYRSSSSSSSTSLSSALITSSSTTTGQTNLMQTAAVVDYLGGDFQTPCFPDQNLGLMGKMHRPPLPLGSRPTPHTLPVPLSLPLLDARGQHPGYR
ncbi:protein FAM222B [Engraulis encrasicolus]|uniref:protein FAM222B n=1 Tax=Engraulis encrasicolus TaxID=184585 RepID=UPI002FD59D7D